MSRITMRLSPYTMGGCRYQRNQYKKARYRRRESREWKRVNKAMDEMLESMK